MVYYTTDGSYLRMVIDHDSDGDNTNNPYTIFFPDGSFFQSSNRKLTDRYGNYLQPTSFTYDGKAATGIEDNVGRKIFSTIGSQAGEVYLYQFGVNGDEIRWTVKEKDVYVRREYQTTPSPGLRDRGGSTATLVFESTSTVIDEIIQPAEIGGQNYVFEYYASDTPLDSSQYSSGWGEISSMQMPSDAVVGYEYRRFSENTDKVLDSSVKKKTLTYLAEYDGSSSSVNDIWEYYITPTTASITSPDGSVMTQTHGNSSYKDAYSGLVMKIENPNGTVIEKLWGFDGSGASGQNSFVKAEFVSIKDANGNFTQTAIKTFTQDRNGNTTSVAEYDFVPYANVPRNGNFGPTGVPSGVNPVRTSVTNYYNATPDSADTTTSSSFNYWDYSGIKNVVASTEIRNSSNQTISRTEITYDNYSTTANPTLTRTWDSTKGALTSPLTDSNSIKTQATYDSYGNVLTAKDANYIETHLTYGNVTCPGGTVTDLYPTQKVIAYGTPVARTSTATYDCSTGVVTSSTDEDNDITNATEYDDLGRPIKAISAQGTALESWTYTTYDDVNRRVIVKSDLETKGDYKKVATQFFDQLGRVRLSKTLEDASYQSATNETDGIKVQTRYKTVSGYTYQLTSNPYRANYSSGETDATMGWTLSTAWSSGIRSEVQTFSGSGLPSAFGGSNSNSTGIVRTDIDANATTVTDQASKLRRSITNGLGQLVRVDEPTTSGLGTVASPNQDTNYAYDTLSNLITVTQGAQTRSFAYSSLSRLTSATNPESGTISYSYDPNGNLTSKIDARSITTTYAYDALNRVTTRSYNDTPQTPTVNYTYGLIAPKVGKLTKVSSSVSTTEYTSFDILGRVTASKQTTDGVEYGGSGSPAAMTYTYNLGGAMVEQQYPSGRVVKNTLDASGDLSIVQSKKNAASGYWNYADSFTYNPAGAVTSMQLGNGRWESTVFNSRLQPTQIALGTVQGGTDKLDLDFTYGTTANNGNVLTQNINFTGLAHPFVQTYTYDTLNRLDDANETYDGTQTWRQDFSFDRYGNRNFVEANTSFAGFDKLCNSNTELCATLRKQLNPGINSSNNNRMNSGQDYTYDSAGNTLTDANGQTFIYDGENKQVEVRNSSNAAIGKYWYDGDGKRVKKEVPGTGEVTIFVYDAAGKQIAEYSTVVASANDAKVAYLTADHLGSPRINTDVTGAVTSRHDYHPFGEEVTASRSSHAEYTPDSVRKQFTGYERDDETDLDFAQARYSNYSLGRFTSPDPLAASANPIRPQSWNRYSYSYNNPLRFTDPSGMIAGDFYDRDGNWLGTDEEGDEKIYVLKPGRVPNKEKNANWGGKLDAETVSGLKADSIEVKGLIILTRTEEGKDYTSGEFKTVGGGEKNVEGNTLEPKGPDTSTSNQDQRVPQGLYDIADFSSKKHPDSFVISNESVSKDRAILFHSGNNPSHTEGCILPGATKGDGTVGGSKPKMQELKTFINSKGANNVKLIIKNKIR